MKEVKAIVRRDRLEAVVRGLREAGVTRLWTSDVHAIGHGIDPVEAHVSADEGAEFMEKAKLEVFCRGEHLDEVVRVIRARGRTGHRGDGVIAVTPLERCVNVRTGDEELLAVL